ncbi:MAG: AMP-binding protein, partial [Bryobacteraceae bacterium]
LFLQFSGGTTGAQKAVVVTGGMLAHQLDRLRGVLNFSERDGIVSWLPMYHDMGLIACLWFPLWNAAPSLQIGAGEWLLKPELLFEYLDRMHATFCWLPNFAFSYLAQRREDMTGAYSLGHVRGWINCSEPVRQRSMQAFAGEFGKWGVSCDALQASYAMAENVFAVTQSPLGAPVRTIPRPALGIAPPAYEAGGDVLVSSGRALPDMDLRIVDASGLERPAGEPGEIQIRTPSLFAGYWGRDGFRTSSLSADGWYGTGDYGLVEGGELFVIGRIKDIVIVGGQNIFPEDVESLAGRLPGVYPGRVVAFGVEDEQLGTESLAVVAELRGEFNPKAAAALELEIRKQVLAAIGVAPRFVAAKPERWIVKSTAGKISRRETRERFERERLAPIPSAKVQTEVA